MISAFRSKASVYLAIFGMVPKFFMAYQIWFWVGLVLNTIAMAILVFFWRAVYANTDQISTLTLGQTLSYILLAQIFNPLVDLELIWDFGFGLREGQITHYLLRPISFQGMYFTQSFGALVSKIFLQIPMAIIAWLAFGLQWPSDPLTWAAFSVTALLGFVILFLFHWFLASLAFFTTEIWGLGMLVSGLTLFLSGALVPLIMMPIWLQKVVLSIPFAQGLAVPINVLTGITPLDQTPLIWLKQVIWIIGLWIFSSLFFKFAIRKLTVQGG